MIEFWLSALVTLLIVVDPLGLVPCFLSVTRGIADARKRIATMACLITLAILVGSALFGEWLLVKLGISMHAFRIAGGLLLFTVASEMVLGLRQEHTQHDAQQALKDHASNVAAFPLAMPLMAGPGGIAAVILLAADARSPDKRWFLGLLVVIALVVLACFVAFLVAEQIGRLLGEAGNTVVAKLLGVLLAALAVQYVVDGGRAAFMGG